MLEQACLQTQLIKYIRVIVLACAKIWLLCRHVCVVFLRKHRPIAECVS